MNTTTSIFDEKTWTVERAIIHICIDCDNTDGARASSQLAPEIRAWLEDWTLSVPSTDAENFARVTKFVAALRKSYGMTIHAMKMHPACWTWFALSKACQTVSTAFKNAFELWVTRQILRGKLPVLQRMQKQEWKKITLDGDRLSFATGVPVATLSNRRFDDSCNSDAWRLKMFPLATDRVHAKAGLDQKPAKKPSAKSTSPAKTPRTSRSSGCEKLLTTALEKLSRLQKIPITEVKSPAADGIRFKASDLGRSELLALVMEKEPALKRIYYKGTVRRSLSFVIRSRLGRPPKSAEAPKKVKRATPAKRKK